MNTCSINFLNSFKYHQIYTIQYIYIYIYKNPYHKTKQIQFDHNTKHRTTHNSNQKINEKKNINHHKTTTQGSEPTNPIKKLKIKTTNLVITHTTKSTNPIKEQKGKILRLSYTNHHRNTGGTKKKFEHITNCWGSG